MRILLFFTCGFAAAVLLGIFAMPLLPALVLSGILLLGTVVLGLRHSRIAVPLLGAALGLLWTVGYGAVIMRPAQKLVGQVAQIQGVATDYSTATTYGIQVPAKITCQGETVRAVVWLYTDMALKPGDQFTVIARLEDPNEDGNYYYDSEGVHLLAFGQTELVLTPADHVPWRYAPRWVARQLERALEECVPEDALGYALALTTGNREKLSTLEEENLKVSGIYHMLALSGMHMTVLVGTVSLLFRRKRTRALVGIPLSIAFAVITGASASIVRAAVMQSLVLLAPLCRKEEDAPTSLSAAALLLMLQNPYCILGWGMQLSFASMAGLLLLSDKICVFLKEHLFREPKWRLVKLVRCGICASLAATCAAAACATPLMMVHFGMISLVAPVTNLLAVWVINCCFRVSLLTALLGFLVQPLGGFLGWCLAWGIRYVQFIADALAKVPFAALDTESIYGFGWVLLVYCMALLVWRSPGPRKRLVVPACCVLVSLVGCLMFTVLQNSGMMMTVVDVGQGQCLIFSDGTQNVMIDCGGSDGERSGDLAAEELMKVGAVRVDVLILTHYDKDHCGGVVELLGRTEVSAIFLPDMNPENELRQQIEAAAEEMHVTLNYINTKTNVALKSGDMTLLPLLDSRLGDNIGLSIVCDMRKFRALVTGDLDEELEAKLMEKYDLPTVDILVAGHHGAANSTSQTLLETVKPKIVVISVGENSYGHPSEKTLERVEAWGACLYRTDQYGTMKFKGA